MRIRSLQVHAAFHFDDLSLDFSSQANLRVVYGPNEAGKSTLLRILLDALFGLPEDDDERTRREWRERYTAQSYLEAEFEMSGTPAFTARRKKQRNRLPLFDAAGALLPEDTLAPYVSHLDRARYRLLFGFDHERLREGGKSLLASGGHAGVSLFEAGGGIHRLRAGLTKLDERLGQLFDPAFRGRSARELNAAWRGYRELMDKSRAAALRSDDWRRLRDDVQAGESRLSDLREQRSVWEGRRSRWRRMQRVRGLLLDWEEADRELRKLGDAVLLSEETCVRIHDLVARLRASGDERARLDRELAQWRAEKDAVRSDEPMLLAEEETLRLLEGLGRYRDALRAAPELAESGRAARTSVAQGLAELAPDLGIENVQDLRISYAHTERLRALAGEIREAGMQRERARQALAELRAEREVLVNRLEGLGDTSDLAVVSQSLADLKRAGDLDAELERCAQEARVCRMQGMTLVQRQTIWKGDWQAVLTLPIPMRETVERYAEAWARLEREMESCRSEVRRLRQEWAGVGQDLDSLEAAGKVPVEEELLEARAWREHGWTLVVRSWQGEGVDERALADYAGGQSLAGAYEKAVTAADTVGDRLRREAGRSAQRAHLLVRRRALEEAVDSEQERLRECGRQWREMGEAWTAEWRMAGIEPKEPDVMRAWLSEIYRPLVEKAQSFEVFRAQRDGLLAKRDALVRQLADAWIAACGRPPLVGEASANAWRETVENALVEAEKKAAERRHLAARAEELRRKESDQLAGDAGLLERTEALWSEWRGWTARYPHLPEEPAGAHAWLLKLDALFGALRDWERTGEDIDRNVAIRREFEGQVGALAVRLDQPAPDGTDAAGQLQALRLRLDAARQAKDRQAEAIRRLRGLEEKARGVEEDRAGCLQELARLQESYACSDLEALCALVERSRLWKDADARREALRTSAMQAGDGLPFEQLLGERREAPEADDIPGLLAEADGALQELDRAMESDSETLWQWKQRFERLDGSRRDAADLAQQAETCLMEVDRLWNETVRAELARRLLRRAIDAFRAENESRIVRRASELFERLTLGRYVRVEVEEESGEPYLLCVTDRSERRRVHQLSDGASDQLYLALRLAFVERQTLDGEPLPLIMDDILVHFDDQRVQATFDVLAELSTRTQIVYFTHHRHVFDTARLQSPRLVGLHELGTAAPDSVAAMFGL